MDSLLLKSYRVCWSDFLILYDALIIYNQRRPEGKTWKELGKGLHTLLKEESSSTEPPLFDDEDSLDFSEDTVMQKVLWQFTHGVALEFLVEELSQYPFWAAKVVAVVDKSYRQNINVLKAAFNYFKNTYERGGIRAIFEGNVPYLAAAVVVNFDHLQKSARGFFSIIETRLPTRPSGSRMNQSSAAGKSPGKPKRRKSKEISTPSKNPESQAPESYWSIASIAGRIVVAGLTHPLILLSVRMLTCPELQSQNWFSSYLSLVTTQGIPVLYTGLRISLLSALLPCSPLYSMGIPETVTYRRMSGQGQEDRFGGSYSVVYSALVEEGAIGLIGYGMLTAVQIVPGFLSFIASKWLLWLLCGTSRQRSRQFKRRKMILENQCWPKYLAEDSSS